MAYLPEIFTCEMVFNTFKNVLNLLANEKNTQLTSNNLVQSTGLNCFIFKAVGVVGKSPTLIV
jgi:hypothetical protein